MNLRSHSLTLFAALTLSIVPAETQAQITHGQKPSLPAPFATPSSDNAPGEVTPPSDFLPTVPQGFHINVFAADFKGPRLLTVAPNGDIFLAETGADQVDILRDPDHSGGAKQRIIFADHLLRPFGIVFHEDYVYIGNMTSVVRFKYDPKTSKRLGEAEKLMELPGGGHITRNLAFTADGKHLLVAVGSGSNIDTGEAEVRAAVTICDPDGNNARRYATGLRNPVGLALEPVTGRPWVTVNERDGLGDDLPPDYFTSIQDGGFYGWPYSYIGSNVDTRVLPPKPDLVAKAIIPDVLLGSHVAPLQFTFYSGKQFPASYYGGAFVAEHGSWNRSKRAGYQLTFVAFKNGQPSADPVPFLTGLVPDASKGLVYGRPVGVTTAPDGSLLVSFDQPGIIYRITYGQ